MLHKMQGSVANHRVLTEDFARIPGANVLAALSNYVFGPATIVSGQSAPYSTALVAPNITVHSSGTFLVWGELTIGSQDAAALVDNDGVSYQVLRNGVGVGPILYTSAQTASGIPGGYDGVVALLPFHFIDATGAAKGTVETYKLNIISTNGHNSTTVATTDGWISILELPPK